MALSRSNGLLRKRVAALTAASIVASVLTLGAAPMASAAIPGLAVLTLNATPDLIQWNQSATVSGKLTFSDLTSTAAEQVTLSITPPGGVKTQISVLTLTAAGTFSVNSSRLRTVGTYTFTADYAGSTTEEAASTDATTVVTVVQLSRSARTVDFKKSVVLIVHLDNYKQTSNHRVALSDAPYPKTTFKRVALAKVKTTGKRRGDATFIFAPGKPTAFIASWWVSSLEVVASNILWVYVRAKVVPDIALFIGQGAFHGRNGLYDLFYRPRACTPIPVIGGVVWIGCIGLLATVLPKRTGSALCFIEQNLSGSGWKTNMNSCFRIGKHGRASAQLVGKEMVGVPYRVMVYFPPDGVMSRGQSAWVYFEFT